MKKLLLIVAALGIVLSGSYVYAGTTNVTLAWDPPNPLAGTAGYRVYKSQTSGSFPAKGAANAACTAAVGTNQCTAGAIADGTWYFVATAYDSAGNESGYSNQVSTVLDSTAPGAPGNLKVTVTVVVDVP